MTVPVPDYLKRMVKMALTLAGAFMLISAACNGNGTHDTVYDNNPVSCTVGKDAPFDMNLTVAQVDSLITANADNNCFTILDVRTESEYNDGHIEGAIRYDYNAGELTNALDTLEKHRAYLVYCRSGGRSARAVADMKEAGFTALYNMLGGFNDWTAAELPSVQ